MGKGGKVKVKCAFCGQPKEIYQSEKRSFKKHFCGKHCSRYYRFNNPKNNSKAAKVMRQLGFEKVDEFKDFMRKFNAGKHEQLFREVGRR